MITHQSQVTQICVSEQNSIGSYKDMSSIQRSSLYWFSDSWEQISVKCESNYEFQENEIENTIWKCTSILSRPQCYEVDPYLIEAQWGLHRPIIDLHMFGYEKPSRLEHNTLKPDLHYAD